MAWVAKQERNSTYTYGRVIKFSICVLWHGHGHSLQYHEAFRRFWVGQVYGVLSLSPLHLRAHTP